MLTFEPLELATGEPTTRRKIQPTHTDLVMAREHNSLGGTKERAAEMRDNYATKFTKYHCMGGALGVAV